MGRAQKESSLSQESHRRSRKSNQHHHHRKNKNSKKQSLKYWRHQRQYSPRQKGVKVEEHLKRSMGQERVDNQQQGEIEQPNFEPSGILLQFYNAREGVSLKFHEPAEARKPEDQWRIYVFKDGQPQNPILLKQSCYLIGKDDRVCDILCENPSISKQHAVIQFRLIHKQRIDGSYAEQVKPYLMDLESTNGTLLNGKKISPSHYFQILNEDCAKFGLSQREYVFIRVTETESDVI